MAGIKDRINQLRELEAGLEGEITATRTGLGSIEDAGEKRDAMLGLGELELQRESAAYRRKSLESRAAEIAAGSSLGKRFRARTFGAFDAARFPSEYAKAKAYAEAFRKNGGEGLMFVGGVGTGKTHLAAAVVNYVTTELAIPARFMTAVDLFGALRDFENGAGTMRELKNVPLLAIDDLGKEKTTEWNREKLFEVINHRYENCLPVVITTNGTPKELEQKLGEAVFSRLCETCSGVMMDGEDYRRRKQ